LLDDSEPNNTTTITFKAELPQHGGILLRGSLAGSVIKSYPPTSVILGETFTVIIIDEAGKSDRISDEFFYDYIMPTGNSTNAIRIYLSTPWVTSGFFYRYSNPDDEFEDNPDVKRFLFTIDSIRLENPDYYISVKSRIDKLVLDGKFDEVQRAYYCRFVRGEKSYFNPESVNKCFVKDYEMFSGFGGLCDLGVDFGGKVNSKTVLTISSVDDKGLVRRLYCKVYEVGKDDSLLDDITELMRSFNIQRIIPDDCPAGDYLIRRMVDKGWNVHPMNFRSEKVKKYGAFRATLNRGEVVSYVDDSLKTEMLSLEFGQGSKQSVIKHAPGYSDDLIDSFVMSTYFFVSEESGFKTFNYYEDEE